MSERPHGYARYKLDGCRCYTCGYAVSRYNEQRDRAIAYGTWQPFVDARPVRDHIRLLQSCGVGLRTIARHANIDRKRLQGILTGRTERGTGPQERVRPQLAAAVLAVEPTIDNIASHTPVSAVGTLRRLHALVAGGWPQHHLAVLLGMSPGNFGTLLRRQQVTASTARAVRGLYDRVSLADPTQHGATPGGVTRARRHAQREGWAPIGAWDEDTIDDPAAHPDWTGQCGTYAGYYAHRRGGTPRCQRCRDAMTARRREHATRRRQEVSA